MKIYCRFSLLILLLSLGCVLSIAGCGSGGGGSNSFTSLNPAPTATETIQMDSTSVQINGTANVTATFADLSDQPISGLQVNFSTTLGSFSPANGSVSTNAAGAATIQLLAGSATGSGSVLASATVNGVKISKQIAFSVVAPQAVISTPQVGLTNLAPGGSTAITVTLTDSSGNLMTTPVDVNFTSIFTEAGTATITSPVRTVNGVASATYTAAGGVGTDTITVSVGTATVTTNVTLAGAAANSISFVSATPANITLKGMGGVGGAETSTVVFKVLDTSGKPKAGQTVDFSLNTSVGGLTLTSPSAISATDGTVSTIILAGVVSTPVRVTATISGSSIATQSDLLVVSTGIPAQDGFSVSLGNLNLEGWNHDGVSTTVTARLSDHFHNPVPDGTTVSFTTSGGSITPSCTSIAGACSVTWTSQNPRPTVARGALRNGRAVIMAHAVGEEFFLDLNGNGLADPTDTWQDDPEAFRDDNEDDIRQASETFIDFNQDSNFNTGDGQFNGVLQGTAFVGAKKTKNVFSNSTIIMSTDGASITTDSASLSGPGALEVTVRDLNGNTMASGTRVTISVPFGTVSGVTNFIVPMNTGFGQTLPVFIAATATPTAQSGVITITVTSPGGLTTTSFVPISGNF